LRRPTARRRRRTCSSSIRKASWSRRLVRRRHQGRQGDELRRQGPR
jgi:hypothetical protein